MIKEEFIDLQYEVLTKWSDTKEIYLAKQSGSNRIVVKKIFDQEKYPIYSELSKIHQKILIEILDVYLVQEKCIVFEEYLQGQTLEEVRREKNLWPLGESIDIILDLCGALQPIHDKKIVHRDINPNNIFITSEGNVKLFDFDISRVVKKQERDTTLLGTAGYAAVEQFGYGQSDVRSDIYALGILLNILLTGVFPAEQIYGENESVAGIIKKCINLDKENRFVNVRALVKELEKVKRLC